MIELLADVIIDDLKVKYLCKRPSIKFVQFMLKCGQF